MPDGTEALRTDHLLADLGGRSVRGGAVAVTAQAGKVVLQFVTVAVLARLLPPAAFGLIAMVASLTVVLDLAKEFGLSAATIRQPDITHAQVSGLFWVNAGVGALIAAGLLAGAPLLALIFAEPALVDVTRALAFGFLLGGLSVQHWALLRRQMRFGAVALVDVGSEAAGFLVALVLAAAHAGYWALVAQRLTVPAVGLVASWALCPWRPGPPRHVRGLGPLLRFGASVACVNVTSALTRSLDQVVIGLLWGAGVLGLYERAAKLLLTPTLNLVIPLYSVTMPLMSRLDSDRERYRRAFREIVGMLAMVVMPGAALVAVTADWVVRIALGTQWSAAAPLVICFALAAAAQPVAQILGLLYLTQDRKRDMLGAALIDTVLFMGAVAAGAWFGALGIAASLAATGWVLRLPVAAYLATRRGSVGLGDVIGAMAPAVVAAVVAGAAVLAVRDFVLATPIRASVGLAASTAVAVVSTLVVLALMPESRSALLRLARMPRLLWQGTSTQPT